MIANSIFILAFWGALGSILVSPKSNKIVSLMTLMITSVIFFFLNKNYLSGQVEPFPFEWLKYMSLQVNIDLSSTTKSSAQILPVYVLSLISMIIAIFNKEESREQRFCCLLALNLCAISGAICSVNLLQLLICSCLMTVLGFCIIDDMDARKKYAFYNLLADLSLFSVCSLVYGYIGSLDFKSLPLFDKLGAHRDLVAVLLSLSVCLKLGLFMFHNQLYDLSVLHFNRLSYLVLCSTPLAGLIILQKFYPLTAVSAYAQPILKIMAVLTLCCGLYNALLMNNIKEKAIGMAQVIMSISLIQFLFFSSSFEVVEHFFLIGSYIFFLILFAIYYAASYELYVSKMGGFISGLKFAFVLIIFASFATIYNLLTVFLSTNSYVLLGFSILLVFITAHIYRQIFFGKTRADERVIAMLKNPAWYLVLPLVLLSFLLLRPDSLKPIYEVGGLFLLFSAFLMFYPLRKTETLYNNEQVQQSDVFEDVFNFLIITPLTILGRILWLLVDFILIERTIINSLSKATSLLIRSASKLNVYTSWLYIFYIVASFGLVVLMTYMGNK